MPIYELGYRPYDGPRTRTWTRWWTITRTGIGLAFRSKFLRRLLYFAWAPLLYFGFMFFVIAFVTEPSRVKTFKAAQLEGRSPYEWREGSLFERRRYRNAREFLGQDLADRLAADPQSARSLVWSVLFYAYCGMSQSLLLVLVFAIVGPPLISQDVRSKSFLLYFSKPITRWEYLAGKGGVLIFFAFLVTLFPALVLYGVSIAFSPGIGALLDTLLVVPRIVGASLVMAIPAGLLMLFLSSLFKSGRFVVFSWLCIWTFGELAFQTLRAIPGLRQSEWIFVLSLRESISTLVGAIFDVTGQIERLGHRSGRKEMFQALAPHFSATAALAWLSAVCAACFAGVVRRISAPMRI